MAGSLYQLEPFNSVFCCDTIWSQLSFQNGAYPVSSCTMAWEAVWLRAGGQRGVGSERHPIPSTLPGGLGLAGWRSSPSASDKTFLDISHTDSFVVLSILSLWMWMRWLRIGINGAVLRSHHRSHRKP